MLKVTCAIIIRQNKILLTQRGNHPEHPFQWEFPGGKIKPGESEEQSLIREIYEELAIDIKILEKMHPVIFDYGFKKIELIPFISCMNKGTIDLKEHNDFRWLKISELPEMELSEADRRLVVNSENRKLFEKYTGEKMNNP